MRTPSCVYQNALLELALVGLFLARPTLSDEPIKLPPKERFHLFLLIGQSNMAGRGAVEAQDKTPHARVLMLNKAGKWVHAIDPLHFDSPSCRELGRRYAEAFAKLATRK